MVRYRVVGLHATSWDERDERGDCGGERELADAEYVCAQLGIELVRIGFGLIVFLRHR
jgi:tRNA U34 2-thiouridine synthase MnmA/TrmU